MEETHELCPLTYKVRLGVRDEERSVRERIAECLFNQPSFPRRFAGRNVTRTLGTSLQLGMWYPQDHTFTPEIRAGLASVLLDHTCVNNILARLRSRPSRWQQVYSQPSFIERELDKAKTQKNPQVLVSYGKAVLGIHYIWIDGRYRWVTALADRHGNILEIVRVHPDNGNA